MSGSALTELTGESCIKLRFVSGSGSRQKTFTVQAHQVTGSSNSIGMTGIYSGTFNLNEFNTEFFGETPKTTGTVELQEIWSSNDLTVGFYTGSVTIRKPQRTTAGFSTRRLHITPVGAQSEYREGTEVSIRFFIEDLDATTKEKAYKLPRRRSSAVVGSCYYRIVDSESGTVVVPFDKVRNSTKVSVDSEGLFINFLSSGLPKGRLYTIHLLLNDMGLERLVKLDDISFRIV